MEKLNDRVLLNKEVLIFDLDGTLIDTTNTWNKIDLNILKKYNIKNLNLKEIQETRDSYFICKNEGDIYLDYCKYLVKKYNLNVDAEVFYKDRKIIEDKLLKKAKLKLHVIKTLEELKKKHYILVLATQTTDYELEIYKKNKYINCLFDYFDLIVTSTNIKKKKPSPEIYGFILKKIRLPKKKFLIIEDSYMGLLCAKNIKIEKVYLDNKYSKKDLNPINRITEYKLNNFNELYKLLKRI